MAKNERFEKVYSQGTLNVIFLIVEIIAFIPLTIEVFGDVNPDVLTISAIVFGVGMVGNCICAIVRAIRESKK